jgi:hypothetical protein
MVLSGQREENEEFLVEKGRPKSHPAFFCAWGLKNPKDRKDAFVCGRLFESLIRPNEY